MDLSLHFAGTGGAVPTAGRGLPSVLLRRGGDRVLIDCGEGTQRQLMRSAGMGDIGTVLLTHHHADHWLGLPGMLRTFQLMDRMTPLDIFGPPGTQALMASLRHVMGRPSYDLAIEDLEAGDVLEFDGWGIEAFNVAHRGVAFGYAVVEHERPGHLDAALAAQLGVTHGPDLGRLSRGETVDGVSPGQVIGPPRRGRRVVLSGDTMPCDMVREAARDGDLLVHEATFLHESLDRALETGHSTATQAAQVAADAGVAMLAVVHVSPRHHREEILAEAREHFPETVAPRDLESIEVPFPEKGPPVLVPRPDRRARAAA